MKSKRSNAPGTILEALALGYTEWGHDSSEGIDIKQPNKLWRRGVLNFETEGGPLLDVPYEAVFVCGRPRISQFNRPKKKHKQALVKSQPEQSKVITFGTTPARLQAKEEK